MTVQNKKMSRVSTQLLHKMPEESELTLLSSTVVTISSDYNHNTTTSNQHSLQSRLVKAMDEFKHDRGHSGDPWPINCLTFTESSIPRQMENLNPSSYNRPFGSYDTRTSLLIHILRVSAWHFRFR